MYSSQVLYSRKAGRVPASGGDARSAYDKSALVQGWPCEQKSTSVDPAKFQQKHRRMQLNANDKRKRELRPSAKTVMTHMHQPQLMHPLPKRMTRVGRRKEIPPPSSDKANNGGHLKV